MPRIVLHIFAAVSLLLAATPRAIADDSFATVDGLLDRGRYVDAIAAANASLAKHPHDELMLNELGVAYRALGRYDEAAAAYGRAVAIEYGPGSAAIFRCDVLYQGKRYAEALDACRFVNEDIANHDTLDTLADRLRYSTR